MAISANGTTNKIVANVAINATVMATPSFAFWYKGARTPGSAAIRAPFGLASSTGTYFFDFTWDHTSVGARQAVSGRESGGAFKDAKLTSTLSSGVWYHIAGTYDGTNVKAWLNGVAEATTACAAFPTTPDPTISAFTNNAGTGQFVDGDIAELGVWKTPLSTDDIVQLALGVSPLMIRADSLMAYWPLIRNIYDSVGGSITATGTTVSDHPRVIYPTGFQGNSYSDVVDKSPKSAQFTDALMLADAGGEETLVPDSITLDDEVTTDTMRGDFADTLVITESWQSKGTYLRTGRLRDRIPQMVR